MTEIEYKQEQLSPEEAVRLLLSEIKTIQETEEVPLAEAGGRILAGNLAAQYPNPPFARSAMDGYAVQSRDVKEASPVQPVVLTVLGELDAGDVHPFKVEPGTAVRIMTGARLPEGCDCVIRQEQTDYGEEQVTVYRGEKPGGNCVPVGEDYQAGETLLEAGEKITYIEQAIAAGMGYARIPVYRKIRAAVLTTGSELTEPGTPLTENKIYDSNRTMVIARLLEWGIEPIVYPIMEDDAGRMAQNLRQACEEADLVVTTGGVSVGKKDILHPAIKRLGARRLFWGIRIKPGMPTLASIYQGIPIISLSGNPFAAATILEILVRPAAAKLSGDPALIPVKTEGTLAGTYHKKTPVRRLLRAIYRNGQIWLPEWLDASPRRERKLHGNSVLASMAGCNCLLDIPEGTEELPAGSQVTVHLLDVPSGTGLLGHFSLQRKEDAVR